MLQRLIALFHRARNTAVGWMLINNGLRLGTGIALLALAAPKFSASELTVYTSLWQLYTFVVIIDATIGANMIRFFGYAMGGATNLKKLGADFSENMDGPNYRLVSSLMRASRKIYGAFGLALFALLIGLGALTLRHDFQTLDQPFVIWGALGLTALAGGLEVYFGWWLATLNGINQVVISSRLSTFAQGSKLLIAAGLLIADFGLLAVPIASLVSGVGLRLFARREVLRILPKVEQEHDIRYISELIWSIAPMCKRIGAVLAGRNLYIYTLFYISGNSPISIEKSSEVQFQFSFMLLTFVASISGAWMQVKWPMINRLRSENRFDEIRRQLFPRFWAGVLTMSFGAIFVIAFFQLGLGDIIFDKSSLPLALMIPLALNFLLETVFSLWTTLLTTDNRVPSLWPTLVHYLTTAGAAFYLVQFEGFGVEALVWTPLVVGLVFNYWYWGFAGSRYLQTSLLRFLTARS